ncbi:hypothetical protein BDZ89DRAFT_706946 [Hymenopellis radicata]|nr:hypothetical protein BDZ89DRAFT_706946 [Hymenopellis radicata]
MDFTYPTPCARLKTIGFLSTTVQFTIPTVLGAGNASKRVPFNLVFVPLLLIRLLLSMTSVSGAFQTQSYRVGTGSLGTWTALTRPHTLASIPHLVSIWMPFLWGIPPRR